MDYTHRRTKFISRLLAMDQAIKTSGCPHQAPSGGTSDLLGESDPIRVVRNLISTVAPTNVNILIMGESGVGKELVARAVHRHSHRQQGPFIAVNCAAITRGLFESELFGHEKGAFTGALITKPGYFERAHGGTLFLDEIGELPPYFQAKLLRVLQERALERVGGTTMIKVDLRLIAATNRDLRQGVAEGWFRRDLYYRLNVVPIALPRLQDRVRDIPLLVAHFLNKYSAGSTKGHPTLSPDALTALERHGFPGNVRELENIIQRAVLLSRKPCIHLDDLPDEIQHNALTCGSTGGDRKPVLVALEQALQNATVCLKDGRQVYWRQQLRCIKMAAILAFLNNQGRGWFTRKSFARFLRSHGADKRCKYKTAGAYLTILKANCICVHNGKKANRSAYRLAERFLL